MLLVLLTTVFVKQALQMTNLNFSWQQRHSNPQPLFVKEWQWTVVTDYNYNIRQKQSPEVFYKKRCSLKFRKIHRKTPLPFLVKLHASGLHFFKKRDCGTYVFLWILGNFQEHLFNRAPLDDCFWLEFIF